MVEASGGKAQWLTLAQLEELVAAYRVDNRVEKKINTLTNCDLVVIDLCRGWDYVDKSTAAHLYCDVNHMYGIY